MRMRDLPSRLRHSQHRGAVVAVACCMVVYTYFGVKFTLFSGRYVFLSGLIGGLALGYHLEERDRSVSAAVTASVLAVLVLWVVFVIDAFRLATEFGVVPPVVRLDPGSLLPRILVFGIAEMILAMVLGGITVLTALVGAWLGSYLASIVTAETA